jgi:prepilin-type N-terminal cleavage/methylation domain-containing protein
VVIDKKGFTIIEIMIVVMVIAVLALIIIPNMIKSRQTASRNSCISNLRQIQGAVQLWSLDARAATNASFTTSDIVPAYMKFWPKEGTAEYPVPSNITSTPVCPNSSTNTDHKL